jgi:membrane protein DedA with SNARE-associated domain
VIQEYESWQLLLFSTGNRRKMEYLNMLETQILSTLQTLFDAWGWFGVAALLIFENATGITPSEIILGLAGWMLISEHQLPVSMIFIGGLYAAIGSTIGSSITFWVAWIGGRPLVDKLLRWLRIDPRHISRTEIQFHRWGVILVLVGRIMPGIRTLINIPAGLSRMPFLPFITATFIGAYTWCTLLIGVGYALGHEWMLISHYLKQYFPYLLAIGLIIFVVYGLLKRQSLRPALVALDE